MTAVADRAAEAAARVSATVGTAADDWDRAGRIPDDVVRPLAEAGLLCPDVPAGFGGPGLTMAELGEFTAHVGALCSSLRSLMTSQGMVAWAVRKLGDQAQQEQYLRRLATGATAAVAFSEAGAGSDLSAMGTTITADGDRVEVTGTKVWVTGSAYADLVLVFGRYGAGGAAVLVPTDAPGVTVTRVADPLGCRAAGHSEVRLDGVVLPAGHLLGGAGMPLEWLVTSVLTYGRLSVAWGCVGMLRACASAAARHAATREQFGKPLAEHQLVGRHLAELHVAEQAATRLCEHAARLWDGGSPDHVVAAVSAKHFAATQAVAGASSAVQVLASAGAVDGHVVARAYRDAKLMEIIEGSSEISQLLLARHSVARWT
ncbi:acyl-CoA dehydrogenase family protein [Actinosynnema sp. NPDC047251]|uniref:Acyl-CoA dehydrogenase domain protein n=1 Tax=Saccharothrix espanaensis (strain ATCC 51144 / DSM 44229 / JCM 9112 / NBRC 15066 / NRRL 15764) TaxID=1179773 RepID=K0JSW1_SACES|nr:acyl-CoA dehydrogenase family protein [Saccharothrix espanaensis]CCH30840.1 Acyl-CoA dehydrogenase domain protein [Saccharothrix espanaensis DSM 44229]